MNVENMKLMWLSIIFTILLLFFLLNIKISKMAKKITEISDRTYSIEKSYREIPTVIYNNKKKKCILVYQDSILYQEDIVQVDANKR